MKRKKKKKTRQVKTQVRLGQVRLGQINTGQDEEEEQEKDQTGKCYFMVRLGEVRIGQVRLGSLVFLLAFGLSQLTSLQFILYHVAGFYKPTIPQSPPSHLQDHSICNNARLEFSTNIVPNFDPNELGLKNGLHSGSSNQGPLGHESSALSTRPQLLAQARLGQVKFCQRWDGLGQVSLS